MLCTSRRRHSLQACSATSEFVRKIFVTAIQMLDAPHDRTALGRQARQHQRGAGPQIGRGNRGPAEPLYTLHNPAIAMGFNAGA